MAYSVTDLLADFFRRQGWEKTMLEHKVEQLWPQVMGEAVARLSSDIEMRDGTLYVRIRSAALRAQLFECRWQVVSKLNEAVGGQIVKDIRLL